MYSTLKHKLKNLNDKNSTKAPIKKQITTSPLKMNIKR